ncbi:unnamed protein product, partial [marine sediment metagenome]
MQHQYYNGYHYYYITGVPVKQDHNYHGMWKYNVPIDSSGKWELLGKLSSDTISEALDSGRYVMLDPWWDSDWDYYKICHISNPRLDYQIELIVDNSSNGGDVNCNNHAQSDFDDIRFLRTDNSTELDYWCETYTADTQATFWINNSYNDSEILMYYGNNAVSTTGNGTNTFYMWDDFDNGYNDNDAPKSSRYWNVIGKDGSDVCNIDS